MIRSRHHARRCRLVRGDGRSRHRAALLLAFLTTLAAATGQGPPPREMIDSCVYPDDAAAQAVWRPMEDTLPARVAEIEGRKALRLPCRFAGSHGERASWDRAGRIDLSDCSGIRFDFRCPDPSPVAQFSVYFQSGNGWYAASFEPGSGAAWHTVTIDKADARAEGRPGGWAAVRTIRVSAWRGGATATEFALSNITKAGVLGGDAKVALLRADSVAGTQPDEARAVEQFSASMAGMLRSLGIPHATLSDLEVSTRDLSRASLVILPHNPRLPEAALDALAAYLQGGGKLLCFYGLPPRLAPLVKIRQGSYVRPQRPGQFAALRFLTDALPGAPPLVGQRSWNIVEALPVEGASRVLAEWADDQGRASGHAAIVGSANCIAMSHVLLADDLPNQRRLLLAMVGRFVPEVWEKSTAEGIDRIGRLAGYRGFDDAAARLPLLRKGEARVVQRIGEVRRLRELAIELAGKRRFAESCDQSAEAARRMMEAFCLAQQPAAGEFRGFWCHSAFGVEGMSWDQAVKRLSEAGFTAVLPNMLWGGSAFYPSGVLPRAAAVTERGDQIAQCATACRKHGIACHVWKVNWNLGGEVPGEFVNKLRAERRLQSDSGGQEGRWLCPSHPENRKLEVESMLEVARDYDIDGLHFDYIRYPDPDHCFCAGCRQRFGQATRTDLTAWPRAVLPGGKARAAWLDWRRDNITAVVREVRQRTRALKPRLQLSAAVFRNWPRDRDGVGQDWSAWCDEGLLDFVCPMDYTPSSASFESMVKAQKEWAGRVPCYPGIGVSASDSKLGPDGVIEQILVARRHGMKGFTIFNLGPAETRDLLPLLGSGITAPP